MSKYATHDRGPRFEAAERRLFDACGMQLASRRVRLADPPLTVRVLEAGDGPPLLLVHGSGMSASTWAPLLPHLSDHRADRPRPAGVRTQRRVRLHGAIAARARGCAAHVAARRARPRPGPCHRHLAGRHVGALSGRRCAGADHRAGFARGSRRRTARHARRRLLHRPLHARRASPGRADRLAECRCNPPIRWPTARSGPARPSSRPKGSSRSSMRACGSRASVRRC